MPLWVVGSEVFISDDFVFQFVSRTNVLLLASASKHEIGNFINSITAHQRLSPRVSKMFPSRHKLSHTKTYASDSGRRQRCATCFLPMWNHPPDNLL